MVTFYETAAAKVNLFLHITGKRPDGYHLLYSQVSFTKDIADKLSFKPNKDKLTFVVKGPFAQNIPHDETNLVMQAHKFFTKKYGTLPKGVLTLEKNLPLGAGIGGGSADAAAALRLFSKAYNINDPKGLAAIANQIGADVSMCLQQMPGIVEGTGDKISKLPHLPPAHIVLVNAGQPLLTKNVFKSLSATFNSQASPLPPFNNVQDYFRWIAKHTNDLLKPAQTLCGDIEAVKTLLSAQKNVGYVGMSGSGATCFALFADKSSAEAARIALSKQQPKWWVKRGTINTK